MTTDTDATAAAEALAEVDAAQRHRELREQFKEWEREGYDGHGRHAGSAKSKGEIRRRRQRRKAKQRARATLTQTMERAS